MKEWVLRVAAVAAMGVLIEGLLPNGSMKKTAALVTSLALLCVLASPLGMLFQSGAIRLTASPAVRQTVNTAAKIESDIRAMLAGHEAYREAAVTVRTAPDGTVTDIEICVPGGGIAAVSDGTLRAMLAARYRLNEEDIRIIR